MIQKNNNQSKDRENHSRQWIRIIVVSISIPLVLFMCGEDLGWWQAWVYSVLFVVSSIGGRVWAERRHPGMLAERHNIEKAQNSKDWDKILAPLMALSVAFPFPIVILAGLDHRYSWSFDFIIWFHLLGFVLIIIGYSFTLWAFIENRFFSTTVRIQEERGHSVCDSGPYRFIRHPGYGGSIPSLLGLVLVLDSVWAVIPLFVALFIIVFRTSLEDRTLQNELPGFKEYTRRVQYKLIPKVY